MCLGEGAERTMLGKVGAGVSLGWGQGLCIELTAQPPREAVSGPRKVSHQRPAKDQGWGTGVGQVEINQKGEAELNLARSHSPGGASR